MELSVKKIAAILSNQLCKINELYRSRNYDQVAIRNQRLWDFIDKLDDCEFWWQAQYQGQRDAGVEFWKYDINPWEVIAECETIRQLLDCGREEQALIKCTQLIDRLEDMGAGKICRPIIFGWVPECFVCEVLERRLYPRWRCKYLGHNLVIRARSPQHAQFEAAQILMDLNDIEVEQVIDNRSEVPSYV